MRASMRTIKYKLLEDESTSSPTLERHGINLSCIQEDEQTSTIARPSGITNGDVVSENDPCGSSKEPKMHEEPTGKDGGYGWVVVIAVFAINVIVAGYARSFGLIYGIIEETFPGISSATGGLMMGLMSGCRGLLAPEMGALAVMMGPRVCTVIGACVSAMGLLLAVPEISPIYLAFTLGALVGTGLCMAEIPGFILVAEYFLEKRATANGFVSSGFAFGGIVFPFFIIYLVENFPFQSIFVVLAAVHLQICVLGMLLRPFDIHLQNLQHKFYKDLQRTTGRPLAELMSKSPQITQKTNKKRQPLNFKLLFNPAYIVYIIMIFFCNMAIPNVTLYLPLLGKSKGLNDWENSSILSFMSICDFSFRFFMGWFSDKKYYEKRHAFVVGLAAAGVSLLLLPLAYNTWTVIAIIWLRALGIATYYALVNSLLADQFGAENMATSWGFIRMIQGITNFFYPPLLGYLADYTSSMNTPFYVMGGMQLLGALVFALQPLVIRITGIYVKLT